MIFGTTESVVINEAANVHAMSDPIPIWEAWCVCEDQGAPPFGALEVRPREHCALSGNRDTVGPISFPAQHADSGLHESTVPKLHINY